MVALSARRFIVIVDDSKPVDLTATRESRSAAARLPASS
jgi:hypothetical protein